MEDIAPTAVKMGERENALINQKLEELRTKLQQLRQLKRLPATSGPLFVVIMDTLSDIIESIKSSQDRNASLLAVI